MNVQNNGHVILYNLYIDSNKCLYYYIGMLIVVLFGRVVTNMEENRDKLISLIKNIDNNDLINYLFEFVSDFVLEFSSGSSIE